MHLSTLLDMSAEGFGDRVAFGSGPDALTYGELRDRAVAAAEWVRRRRVECVGLVDESSDAVPVLLYGAAVAGVPFAPMNYRLDAHLLSTILARTAPSVVVVEEGVRDRVGVIDGVELVTRKELLAELDDILAEGPSATAPNPEPSVEDIAVLLFTSGTTGEPKAAVLRHKHLGSYVISTVDFMGADEDEAALVSVPPYHVAGISAVLSSVFAGRRIVYLSAFTPEAWVDQVRRERITQAMVVPTMLGRILDVLEREDETLPALRHLAYGGGRMPVAVIERALTLLPHVEFVNAYGLTETSSTIAVLGAADHRAAVASDDDAVRQRLGSVGRPLPTLEVEIRDGDGDAVAIGATGELWVRGEQVAGEYLGRTDAMVAGWFPTRDAAHLDEAGYLYLEGRLDDVIVRGAENLSPGEIEDVLVAHPEVVDAAVVGVPDQEWGEAVAAAVVLRDPEATGATAAVTDDELRTWVRERLRSSKVPQHLEIRRELPYNETGKLLRRILKSELTETYGTVEP